MNQDSVTWIVTADATDARVFCERTRMGPLQELVEHRMSATADERRAGDHHRGDQRAPQHEPERRFLTRVAARIAAEAGRREFSQLVLMGPPHALGALRKALPQDLLARVEVTDDHERRQDDAEALRRHLRDARARQEA